MRTADAMLASDFATLPDLIAAHARAQPARPAIADADTALDYATLDATIDRVVASLQRDGVAKGDAVAIVAVNSVANAVVFLGAIRAGCVPAPIAPSATDQQIAAMIADCRAGIVFADKAMASGARVVTLDALEDWLVPIGTRPDRVEISPGNPFNIIYSSGTTGTPKGIVQSHAMRWAHIARAGPSFADAVTLIAVPLYSNTTLVSFLPTLGWGGSVVLMGKFDARGFLELAQRHRATHTMLVPVQYQRIMALPDFDSFDLSAFRFKSCTSAPFSAALKADILARWPGLLIEYYGMTEGGGTCLLVCNQHPGKLHTVGQPVEGHDIRLIDDDGREVAPGEVGEVVGRSPAMMSGYFGRDDATAAAIWHNAAGNAFIRHGDIGRFDADGFLTLLDRKKDLIISGGFNLYPADLEAVLAAHPAVADCAVIGVPSDAWGETPIGYYVPRGDADPADVLAWCNERLGRTQRLSALHPIDELPRSAIGKVLRRELRDRWQAARA